MSFFEADQISINFGGIRAVDGVSFDVKQGEVFTIIGPNGAGKTTIFNLVSRIYEPTAGRLSFDGTDITNVAPHRIAALGIARPFQNIELFEHATLLQNLLLARHAHKIAYLAPDIFTILLSIQFLLLVIVGGLGSLHGAVFGAIFVALLPPVIAILRDSIPDSMAEAASSTGIAAIGIVGELIGNFLKKPGVEAGIFGLILVLVILLEPLGMYGRWMKIRLFFSTFPMYKRDSFKRQKSYMKTERLR